MKKILLIFILVLCVPQLRAQDTLEFSGTILENGTPLQSSTTVTIEHQGTQKVDSFYSASNGSFYHRLILHGLSYPDSIILSIKDCKNNKIENVVKLSQQIKVYRNLQLHSCPNSNSIQIAGRVTEESFGMGIPLSIVEVYSLNAAIGELDFETFERTDASGYFEFSNNQNINDSTLYILRVIPFFEPSGMKVGSGYLGGDNWESARLFSLTDLDANSLNVSLQSAQTPNGTFKIQGKIHHSTIIIGNIKPEPIKLTYFNGEFVSHVMSNDKGYFEFSNLEAGQYAVHLDIPGIPAEPAIVEVNPIDTVAHPHLMYSPLSIHPVDENGVALSKEIEINESDKLKTYPNPFNQRISFSGIKQPIEVEIRHISGAVMWSGSAENGITLKTTSWQNGIYIVDFKDSKKKQKLVKY